ncbi:MAG: ABC transporter ATP-binding protein [bacterium]|nr:ABC transporter ATP-binding protein [bacterium]
MNGDNILLKVNNLQTHFFTPDGVSKAVDGVSFSIRKGEVLGLVGESGCGKSVASLSILRLIQYPPGKIVNGEIWFKDRNLIRLPEEEMRRIRGNEIAMIFQEPMTSLNPVFTIGNQIAEVFIVHKKMKKQEANHEAVRMLDLVKIPSASQRAKEYPHQLSGGMRQRVMIAMALACTPALLIADEPTTALDVTVQAQILDLMRELLAPSEVEGKEKFESSILIITHDLGIIAGFANYVAVMYAGQLVEYTDVETIFDNPLHPYTKGLLQSVPRIDKSAIGKSRLKTIEGTVPDPLHFPSGCRFHPRCPIAIERCSHEIPDIEEKQTEHLVRCLLVK